MLLPDPRSTRCPSASVSPQLRFSPAAYLIVQYLSTCDFERGWRWGNYTSLDGKRVASTLSLTLGGLGQRKTLISTSPGRQLVHIGFKDIIRTRSHDKDCNIITPHSCFNDPNLVYVIHAPGHGRSPVPALVVPKQAAMASTWSTCFLGGARHGATDSRKRQISSWKRCRPRRPSHLISHHHHYE